jgi:hypothetical protein
LISCRRATMETDDPGCIVSSTTRRFFSYDHCRVVRLGAGNEGVIPRPSVRGARGKCSVVIVITVSILLGVDTLALPTRLLNGYGVANPLNLNRRVRPYAYRAS